MRGGCRGGPGGPAVSGGGRSFLLDCEVRVAYVRCEKDERWILHHDDRNQLVATS